MTSAGENRIADLAGRAVIVGFFGMVATFKVTAIFQTLHTPEIIWIDFASHVAQLAFVSLLLWVTVIRFKPVRRLGTWESHFSALAGSLLPMALLALPLSDAWPMLRIVGVGMVAAGWALSAYVLMWLGRSFSVMPQARRLVTTGPYGVVRHPLYLAEEVAVLGTMLLSFSPAAVVIATVHWLFQLRRMMNEEKVLLAAFPEYSAYSADTPRVIPSLISRRGSYKSTNGNVKAD
jgi:protein-S-isoprenylcysteine O-methyltransferase Ste14